MSAWLMLTKQLDRQDWARREGLSTDTDDAYGIDAEIRFQTERSQRLARVELSRPLDYWGVRADCSQQGGDVSRQRPIFIVGMLRSGSSLLETLVRLPNTPDT